MKYLLLIICTLFVCCNNKKNAINNSAAEVIMVQEPVAISIDDYILDYDTIRLETTNESLIGVILQMHIMDSTMYIFDYASKAIFIFSDKGKFISKIRNVGKGPDEYITISSFEIDYSKKQIVLSDEFSKKVLIYDNAGKHIKTVKLDNQPILVAQSGNRFINFYSEAKQVYSNTSLEDFIFHYYDNNGKFLYSLKDDDTPLLLSMQSKLAVESLKDGTILYCPALSDTVYAVNSETATPKYVVQSESKYKIPDSKIAGKITTENRKGIEKLIRKNYLITWGSILDMDDYFYMNFSGYKQSYDINLFFSKSKKKSITIDPDKMTGDKALIAIFTNYILTSNNNDLYTVVPFKYVKDNIEEVPEGKLKTFLVNTEEGDNPVILKYKINDNLFN